jgi:hypothetical protein
MIVETDVEADLHIVTEMMNDIAIEALVPEDVRPTRMRTSRFLAEILEMFQMFRFFSWNS